MLSKAHLLVTLSVEYLRFVRQQLLPEVQDGFSSKIPLYQYRFANLLQEVINKGHCGYDE